MLFADEPTGNLDRQTETNRRTLFSLNREHGTTLILVTHDPAGGARCDRRLRLVNGPVTGGGMIARWFAARMALAVADYCLAGVESGGGLRTGSAVSATGWKKG